MIAVELYGRKVKVCAFCAQLFGCIMEGEERVCRACAEEGSCDSQRFFHTLDDSNKITGVCRQCGKEKE
jgi:hypothetical protein